MCSVAGFVGRWHYTAQSGSAFVQSLKLTNLLLEHEQTLNQIELTEISAVSATHETRNQQSKYPALYELKVCSRQVGHLPIGSRFTPGADKTWPVRAKCRMNKGQCKALTKSATSCQHAAYWCSQKLQGALYLTPPRDYPSHPIHPTYSLWCDIPLTQH